MTGGRAIDGRVRAADRDLRPSRSRPGVLGDRRVHGAPVCATRVADRRTNPTGPSVMLVCTLIVAGLPKRAVERPQVDVLSLTGRTGVLSNVGPSCTPQVRQWVETVGVSLERVFEL